MWIGEDGQATLVGAPVANILRAVIENRDTAKENCGGDSNFLGQSETASEETQRTREPIFWRIRLSQIRR